MADVVFAYAERRREIAPKLRMWSGGVFLLGKIFEHHRLQRLIGSRGENPQMLWECLYVPVILRGIELERFTGKFSRLPILIKRMSEQIFAGDSRVDFFEQLCVGHYGQASAGRRPRREKL